MWLRISCAGHSFALELSKGEFLSISLGGWWHETLSVV